MKLYFKRFLQFLFFSIPCYIVILLIWGQLPLSNLDSNLFYRQGSYGHLNTRLDEITSYGDVDILFVGSSRVYRGFDPRIFAKQGIKVFVLGSSSQTPIQSYYLLKRYLNDLKPKLVVYDLLPSSFSIPGIEPSLDLMANDKIDEYNLEIALEQNDILIWNTLVYASIHQFFGIHNNFKEREYKKEDHDTYINGGYIQKDLGYIKSFDKCEKADQSWPAPIEMQKKYFLKIVELLKNNSVPIKFINMPIANYKCFDNNNLLPKQLSISANYLDMNKNLHLVDSIDFYDDFHLNQSGVLKNCNFFIDYLSQ
jgi:hypothetical protein